MSDREVYPNAPVVLVAIEVRHPTAEPLAKAAIADLKRSLAREFPLYMPATTLTFTVSPTGMAQDPQTAPRYVSRDKTASVTFREDAIVVETTRYEHYERLREMAALAVDVRQRVAPVDGVERIGLRYINEVRVPELRSSADWAEWVAPALAGPTALDPPTGLDLNTWQGTAIFGDPTGSGAAVRHGSFEGYAVNPGGDLKRPAPAPGPFFLIDIDSYWTAQGETPNVEQEELLTCLDGLNSYVKVLFEGLITDRLRNEVLRDAR
ncbi:TIGR04255 family protein [Kitasatospora cineracea]|uniref:TIGR04255 family protein n=1 Tax=Kitasatospora cineracea TaxID=88074 RepID=UPI0036DAE65F